MKPRPLPLLCLLAACGGGPHLSHLRCRDAANCQDVEDPLKLLLQVDFTDDSGTLDKGVLDLKVSGNTQQTVTLAGIFAAQGIAAGTKTGTFRFDGDIVLDRMQQNQQVEVSAVAANGKGDSSNEPTLTFTLHLGGP